MPTISPVRSTRAGIYLRVSTDHQSVESQRKACFDYCQHQGWAPVVYQDVVSGAVASREGLDQLMHACRRRTLDAVLVFSFTRLGRSARQLLAIAGELKEMHVQLVSLSEPWLCAMQGAVGDLLLAVFGFCAQVEREQCADRVRAGLRAAAARGQRLGRRPAAIEPEELAELIARGTSILAMGRHFGVDAATIRRHLAKMATPENIARAGAAMLAAETAPAAGVSAGALAEGPGASARAGAD